MRFTIRDLLWLVALIAVGLGWWINRLQLLDGIERAKTQSLPGRYVIHLDSSGNVMIDTQTGQMWRRSTHSGKWLDYSSPVLRK